MHFDTKYITPDIKLSCYEDRLFKTEATFEHHMLVWFISGETRIVQADHSYLFKPGDIFLIPRNQLAAIINYPKDGQPHKTVVMHLSASRLQAFYADLPVKPKVTASPVIRTFSDHPLLKSCMASLVPYFELPNLPENIADLKIREAISILRTIDPDIDDLLANFEEPGKIHLADFMERNFMFNMPMGKFGYLTGRSLTTFKRDFKKIFHTSPEKWLVQKRLALAHYQLSEKSRKPAEVYLEVGFENLSHFSFAFKKHFGYTPTALMERKY